MPVRKQHAYVFPKQLLAAVSEKIIRSGICKHDLAVCSGDQHAVGRGFQQRSELLFRLGQNLRLATLDLRAAAQFHKDSDLRAKNFRHDRLEQEIHRAEIVAPKQMLFVAVRGEK